jgi:hypothetical protein
MSKLLLAVALALSIALAPLQAAADCDFSKGITKVEGGYLYTPDCHKKVGKIQEDLKDREEQVAKLEKTIELKDLGIKVQEERADKWMNTAFKLEDRVNSMERLKSTNQWLYFGIGVVATSLAVWGAGQLAR